MITENLSTLKIHKLTQEQYDRELASGNIDENALYLTPDVVTDVDELIDMMNEYKEETNTALSGKSDTTHTHDNYEEVGVAATKANEALESAKSYTDQEIADLVNAAPETLDTLGELATAMKENQDVVDVLNNAITLKANKEEITNEINSINENIENIEAKDLFETKHEEGNTIAVSDSAEAPFVGMKLYGKTTQNGTPTPDAPIPLVSVGDSGSFEVGVYGKNLFDGVVYRENGMYEEFTGTWNTRTDLDTYRIPVLPNTKYKKLGDWNGIQVFFDKNMNYLAGSGSNTPPGSVVTAPNNSAYYCCTISKDVDKSNVEFKQVQTLSMPYELRSARYDTGSFVRDEIDLTKGINTEKTIKYTFNGSEDWQVHANGFILFNPQDITIYPHYCWCDKYPQVWWNNLASSDYGIFASDGYSCFICVKDKDCSTVEEFKSKLASNPITVIGIRRTPIETELTEEELNACRQLHTNKPNTTILSEADMEVDYVVDSTSAKYIENRLEEVKDKIENIEISGRNLFKNLTYAGMSYTTSDWNNGTFTAMPEKNGFNLLITNYGGGNSILGRIQGLGFNNITGYYTFSANVYASADNTTFSIDICDSGDNWFTIGTTKQKITFTAYVVNFTEASGYNGFIDIFGDVPTGTTIYFEDVKIERGTKATDWTLALEDMATIQDLDDKLSFDEEVVNSESSVSKIVPEGSGKYAAVNKVGGMSYKSKNILEIDFDTQTVSGVTFTNNGNGSVTMVGTATETIGAFYLNKKQRISVPSGSYKCLGDYLYNHILQNGEYKWSVSNNEVFELGNGCDSIISPHIFCYAGATFNTTIYPMIIRAEETDTSFEPYYSGLRDAYVSQIKSVGKNLFDIGTDKSGYFTTQNNGAYIATSKGEIANNIDISFINNSIVVNSYPVPPYNWLGKFIELTPNTDYTISAENNFGGARIYGANSNIIGTTGTQLYLFSSDSIQGTFNSGNYKYYWISFYPGEAGAKLENCQIEIGTEATEYEPYKTIEPFIIPTGARGVGYGMGINESCYNYIDFERKVYIQNCVKVNLGSLEWVKSTNDFYTTGLSSLAKFPADIYEMPVGLIAEYTMVNRNDLGNWNNNTCCLTPSGNFSIVDNDYTDATSFKTAITGVYLIYKLATPIETDISDYIQDNFIEVAESGVITAVNEYGYDVPTEYEFFTSENPEKVIVADKIVGDFVGTFMGELTTSGTVAATSFKIGEGCNLVYDTTNKCVSFQFI